MLRDQLHCGRNRAPRVGPDVMHPPAGLRRMRPGAPVGSSRRGDGRLLLTHRSTLN